MLDKICPAFWSKWTDWERCDKECGPGGHQKRVRYCQEFYTNYDSTACKGHGVMTRHCKTNKRCSENDSFVLIPYIKYGKGRLIDMKNPNASLCLVPLLKSDNNNLGFGLDMNDYFFYYMLKSVIIRIKVI